MICESENVEYFSRMREYVCKEVISKEKTLVEWKQKKHETKNICI